MSTEAAIFTAIPAGRMPEHGLLKVTVFVTPRLSTGAPAGSGIRLPLADFAAFANWPKTLTEARWAIEVDGLGVLDGIPLTEVRDPGAVTPDPQVWEELFGATAVGEAGFQDFSQAVVHSYPVAEVARAVAGLYQTVAVTSPTAFPTITRGPLAGKLAELRSPLSVRERFGEGGHRRAIRELIAGVRRTSDPRPGGLPGRFLRIEDVPPAERPAFALAAATTFYDRTDDPWDGAAATAAAPPPIAPEFHSFVARCADYPALLRHLGLAIDIGIPDDGGIREISEIRVASGFNGGLLEELIVPATAPEQARPRTLAHRTDRAWAPASRSEVPDIVDGSLTVDDARRFLVDQLDPDGAALKLTTLLAHLERTDQDLRDSAQANNGAESMTADASSLPALRSTGIIVARQDRAADMVAQFDRSARHDQRHTAGQPAQLGAEDVTRGWRIDIQDEKSGTREWFSLHRREGRYELVAPGADARPLSVQPAPDEGYLKAAATSSAAPDPAADQYLHETLAGWDGWSLAVKRPGKVVGETAPVDPATPPEVADTGFPLAARFRVQRGSLPRLRFGRAYRLRVRAVDLSGMSIPDDQLDEAHERDLETYQRWEPVPSPAVIPLTQYTEGESLMRLVIRSTLDVPVEEYIALDRVRTLPGHEPGGDAGVVYRARNERHLAAPIGSVQLAETHGMFDAALTGDAGAVAAQFQVAAREAGSFLTAPGAQVINPRGPADALTGQKDQVLPDGQYVVHPAASLDLPYLPDPLSRGISLTTLPGDEAGGAPDVQGDPPTRLLRWPGDPADWTDRRPVLLRVVEGDGPPDFDADARVLTVALPKATLRTVHLSSFLDDADIDLMRVWHLIDEDQAPASAAQRETVRRGRHWMITPASDLTLVHAVEKPLEAPEIRLEPGWMRDVDATFSLLPGVVHNHAASTGRLDIDAAWSDPVDDVLEPMPREEGKRSHVSDFEIQRFEVDARLWRTNGPPAGPYGPRHAVRHEFGDTRHRWVDYTPTATTRFREYFPARITDDPALTTSTGAALRVDVPSSSRPAPPDVQYLVPYWEWRTEALAVEAPFAVRRIRTAGGLRVYLGRPWFSSGPDELLGVVLARQPHVRWPVDVDAGILVDSATRGAAQAWAQEVVAQSAIGAPGGDATTLIAERLAQAAQATPAPERGIRSARPRTALDRFLVSVDRSIGEARTADADLSAAADVRATAALVTEFRTFTPGTGAAGLRFTTAWGADPVFAGESLPAGPYATHFPRRTAVGTVALAEVPDTVVVVGHQPEFDPERRLWFCDVAIESGDAYTPFVQLALARYQPHSVPGVEISSVVRADWLQPLPRREATFTVTPDSSAVILSLAGTVGVPEHARGLPDLASEIRASRRIAAWAERLPADATSDLDWTAVGDPVELDVRLSLSAVRQERFAEAEWVGSVALPERVAGERLRVQLAEYEVHEADTIGLPPLLAILPQRDHRLVYADSVELP